METNKITRKMCGVLCFAQSGDLEGIPVFFFHGAPGSRLFHPPEEITKKYGVRLITIDRPGYGESSFQPQRTILDWAMDIKELAGHLRIEKFHLASHSAGGPYLLACSHAIHDQVISASLISSVGPYQAIKAETKISKVNQLGFRFSRYLPWIVWKSLVFSIYKRRSQNPNADIDHQANNRTNADAELINIAKVRENCVESEVEAFKNGMKGLAWDVRLITRPWGFLLEEIKVPISIWHGSDDNEAPVAMAQYLASKIPFSSKRIIQGEAHLMIYKYWEEILIDLLGANHKN